MVHDVLRVSLLLHLDFGVHRTVTYVNLALVALKVSTTQV